MTEMPYIHLQRLPLLLELLVDGPVHQDELSHQLGVIARCGLSAARRTILWAEAEGKVTRTRAGRRMMIAIIEE